MILLFMQVHYSCKSHPGGSHMTFFRLHLLVYRKDFLRSLVNRLLEAYFKVHTTTRPLYIILLIYKFLESPERHVKPQMRFFFE